MSPMKKVPFLANLWYLSVPLVKVLEQVSQETRETSEHHKSTSSMIAGPIFIAEK